MKLFNELFPNKNIKKIFDKIFEEEIKYLRTNISIPIIPLDDRTFYKGSPMEIYIRYDFNGSKGLEARIARLGSDYFGGYYTNEDLLKLFVSIDEIKPTFIQLVMEITDKNKKPIKSFISKLKKMGIKTQTKIVDKLMMFS